MVMTVGSDPHGHVDKLLHTGKVYTYSTQSVLCMGLTLFQHSVPPSLYSYTGTFQTSCISFVPCSVNLCIDVYFDIVWRRCKPCAAVCCRRATLRNCKEHSCKLRTRRLFPTRAARGSLFHASGSLSSELPVPSDHGHHPGR